MMAGSKERLGVVGGVVALVVGLTERPDRLRWIGILGGPGKEGPRPIDLSRTTVLAAGTRGSSYRVLAGDISPG